MKHFSEVVCHITELMLGEASKVSYRNTAQELLHMTRKSGVHKAMARIGKGWLFRSNQKYHMSQTKLNGCDVNDTTRSKDQQWVLASIISAYPDSPVLCMGILMYVHYG